MANSSSLSTLHSQLDTLWLRYLNLLEEYTTAQTHLSETFSAGFFSLAEANFKSGSAGLGGGRRFGRDYYDERMVARMRVKVGGEDGGGERGRVRIEMVQGEEKGEGEMEGLDSKGKEKEAHGTEDRSPSSAPSTTKSELDPQTSNDSSRTSSDSADTSDSNTKPQIDPHDPLRWFGILIPSSLRTAQTHFSQAVADQNCISKAVNAARGMREIEIEIRKLRKVIRKAEKESIAAAEANLSKINLVKA